MVDQGELRGVGAGAVDRAVEPVVELAARADDEVGALERLDVLRPDLVVVRVGVGLEELHDVGAVAGDRAGEVGRLRRGGDDREPAVGARVRAAAARDDERGAGEEEGGGHAHRCEIILRIILVAAPGP